MFIHQKSKIYLICRGRRGLRPGDTRPRPRRGFRPGYVSVGPDPAGARPGPSPGPGLHWKLLKKQDTRHIFFPQKLRGKKTGQLSIIFSKLLKQTGQLGIIFSKLLKNRTAQQHFSKLKKKRTARHHVFRNFIKKQDSSKSFFKIININRTAWHHFFQIYSVIDESYDSRITWFVIRLDSANHESES